VEATPLEAVLILLLLGLLRRVAFRSLRRLMGEGGSTTPRIIVLD
tara:strand:- start:3767 stop:3901 length:135 start_codon:yes stop_codon:yes gene_type:complete